MGRASGGARGASEDDAQHVAGRDLVEKRPEMEELGRRARRVPVLHVRRGVGGHRSVRLERRGLLMRPEQVAADRVEVVAARLDTHQQAVEAGDVDPGREATRLERLHEGRPGPRKRVEHMTSRNDIPVDERLDELRHELPEVGMETMDVLRPLPFGKLRLGPREREVEPAVEGLLRGRHTRVFVAGRRGPRRRPRAAPYKPLAASNARRRSIRTAMGGCVEKSDAIRFPESGLAM